MALNKVTLTGTYLDGEGNALSGSLKFVPNTQLADATDSEIIRQSPITVTLSAQGTFSVQLYATDNTHLLPSGWVWNATEYITGLPANAYSFFLAFTNGATQDISALATITDAPQTSQYVPSSEVGQPSGVAALNSSGYVPLTQGGTGAGSASTALAALGAASAAALTAETSRAGAAEGALLPLAGGTMSGAIAMGSHKVTGLANGTVATDAAAFGQIAPILTPTAVKTSGYTAVAGDFVLCDTQTTGSFTVTLPTAPADKTAIGVKMVKQASTNAVTIARGGSDTFNQDSSTTATLALLNQSAIWQYDAALTAWIKVSADLPLAQLDSRYVQTGGKVWSATSNGMKCDGTTDDTTALNALLLTVHNAGGGTITIPSLARINGQVALPWSAVGQQAQMAPIRIMGTATSQPGQTESGVPYPSGGLDLRYAGRTDTGCGTALGSVIVTDTSAAAGDYGQIVTCPGVIPDRTYVMAVNPGVGYTLSNGARATNASASLVVGGGKIQTFGIGTLELDHLLLCDQGTSSQPFVLTTGTTVHQHDCTVLGGASKTGVLCDQDIFLAGGPGHGCALSSALVSGNTYTTLAVTAVPVPLLSGGLAVITDGTNSQTVTLSAGVSTGATSIAVTSFTASANFAQQSAVQLFAAATTSGVPFFTSPNANYQGYGTHLTGNWFDRVRRILAQNMVQDFYVDHNVWWQNCGSSLVTAPSTLTSALSSGNTYTSLAVTALSAAVNAGDQIQVGTGSPGANFSQVVTASSSAAASATSIAVNSFTANNTYATGTVAFNTTAGIGAAFETFRPVSGTVQANFQDNRVEMSGWYSYVARFGVNTQFSTISGNNINDTCAAVIAAYRFDSGAGRNLLMGSLFTLSGKPFIDDQSSANANGNQIVLAPQAQQALFPAGVSISSTIKPFTMMNGASNGFVLTSDASGNGTWQAPSAQAPNIQFFTSSGTWTRPSGAQTVLVAAIGAGGGGGSGAQGSAGTVRTGGGAGAGANFVTRNFAASDLTSTVTVTIGAAGTSGAAVTAGGSGNAGGNGGSTTFGAFLIAVLGLGGAGGSTAQALGGAAGTNGASNSAGGNSSATGAAGSGSQSAYGGPGGGSGGGITTGNAASNGGGASFSWLGGSSNQGTAGVVDTTIPTAGTQPAVQGTPSCGGGGGASSITTNAQAGANAFYGGGGGGGGASVTGTGNSGAGGTGGPGFVLVITHFA